MTGDKHSHTRNPINEPLQGLAHFVGRLPHITPGFQSPLDWHLASKWGAAATNWGLFQESNLFWITGENDPLVQESDLFWITCEYGQLMEFNLCWITNEFGRNQ